MTHSHHRDTEFTEKKRSVFFPLPPGGRGELGKGFLLRVLCVSVVIS